MKAVGVRVVREVIGKDNDKLTPFNTFNKGTSLALLVDAGGKNIIKVDTDKSKLDSFTDESGNSLLVKTSGFSQDGFGGFPKVSADGKVAMFEVSANGVPDAKSNKVIAKGSLLVQTGSTKKTVKSEPFELVKGTKVMVGDIELTIKKTGKPSYGDDAVEVEFESKNEALPLRASAKFYDAAGAELESDGRGSSRMGFMKKFTYGQTWGLKKAVTGKVVLEFEVWTDLETKTIPFEISAGVGG